MYILEPVSHETLWGGDKTKKYGGSNTERIGHLYIVNGHAGLSNEILNGDLKGRIISDVFPEMRDDWNMSEFDEFPLTVALTDARENLSIQVHPDDTTAMKLENKKIGKKESWIFLTPPDSGWIYAGCKCKTQDDIRKNIGDGSIESAVAHLPIEKGDYVCVSSGTLHALTAGSFVYEVEYGSDFTYRLYDYGRIGSDGKARETHIEKGIYSIKPEILPNVIHEAGGHAIREDVYEVDFIKETYGYRNMSSEIECIALLDADGICENINLKAGMGILLFPGEEMQGATIHRAITAKLTRDMEV